MKNNRSNGSLRTCDSLNNRDLLIVLDAATAHDPDKLLAVSNKLHVRDIDQHAIVDELSQRHLTTIQEQTFNRLSLLVQSVDGKRKNFVAEINGEEEANSAKDFAGATH